MFLFSINITLWKHIQSDTSIYIDCVSEYANHMKEVQLMVSTCSVIAFLECLLQPENRVTGRAYMGEVLIQDWLKSIKK